MEVRIDQDHNDLLKFYAVPQDRVRIDGILLNGMTSRMATGRSVQESWPEAKRDIARETLEAFTDSRVHRWLKQCGSATVAYGIEFEHERGTLPMPRISITFADASFATKFKVAFVGTNTSRGDGAG